jgi:hypothetical protein
MSNEKSVALKLWVAKFWWVGFVLFAFPVVIRKIQDVDLWWHKQLGRGMVNSWSIPDLNSFYWSYVSNLTPDDFRFTWLGDVLLHVGYQLGGAPALQLALLASVIASVFLFLSLIPQQQRYLALPLGMLVVAATYQLQILRNAAFGILLFALLCWLWHHAQRKPRLIWAMVPLLGFWSCVHGSYLLGFMVFALLFSGAFVERILAAKVEAWQEWGHELAALILSFVVISIENPFTLKAISGILGNISVVLPIVGFVGLVALGFFYFSVLRHWDADKRLKLGNLTFLGVFLVALLGFTVYRIQPMFGSARELAALELRLADDVALEDLSLLQKVKHGLNNLFWRAQGEVVASLDFHSPFDYLSDLYVWASLLLLFIALPLLVRWAYGHWAMWTAFLPLCLLGLGYVRTIGLAGMFAAFLICRHWQLSERWQQRLNWPSLAASALLLFGVLGQITQMGVPFGLYKEHRVGFGAEAFFPVALAPAIKQTWPDTPVFTTIENGGYLLYQWYPAKRVFMDGFVGPHKGPALNLYNQAREAGDPELLFESVGAEVAVVGLRDSQWLQAFSQSEQWVPVHFSVGGISFQRCDGDLACSFDASLLLDQAAFHAAPDYLQSLLSYHFYTLSNALLSRGYLRQVQALWSQDNLPLVGIEDQTVTSFQATLKHLAKNYNNQNSPWIAKELSFFQALNRGDDRRAFQLGRQLLDTQPKRGDLYLRMIETAQRIGNQEVLEKLITEFEALQEEVRNRSGNSG